MWEDRPSGYLHIRKSVTGERNILGCLTCPKGNYTNVLHNFL